MAVVATAKVPNPSAALKALTDGCHVKCLHPLSQMHLRGKDRLSMSGPSVFSAPKEANIPGHQEV